MELRKQLKEQKKAAAAAKRLEKPSTSAEVSYNLLHVTTSRKVKVLHATASTLSEVIGKALKNGAVELSCSRLCTGPLENRVIKIWYQPEATGIKNRRASKLAGFPIVGEMIVECPGYSLTEVELVAVEALLI